MHDLEQRLGDAIAARGRARRDARRATASCRSASGSATATASTCKIATVLRGLGFEPDDFERPTETFSGGWQMRIALAKLLLGRPDLLLLDEPTNHLDLDARNWLEEYLVAYPHAVILVSHDRYFLDAVVTRIADSTLRTLTDYDGNYSEVPRAARRALERLRKAKREQDEEVARVEDVHRPVPLPGDQGGAGAEPHQDAREGRADRGAARAQAHPLHVSRRAPKSGRTVLELKHARKAYGDARRSSTTSTCTSSAAIASRWSGPTAPASRR